MNNVSLIGRLTKDPDVRKTNTSVVAKFSLAIPKIGREGSDFINIVTFGSTAEAVQKYLFKGSQVGINGKITSGSYEKDGRKVYTTEVWADRIEFLGGKKDEKQESIPTGFSQTNEDIPF